MSLETKSTDELTALRGEAAASYYGSGTTLLTDDAFDALTDELARRGVDELVGHGASGGKVAHLRPMLSLKKVHDVADLKALLAAHPGADYTIEPKWDGLAVSVRYNTDGRLERAVTRGDGEQGDDITPAIAAIFARQGIPEQLSLGAGEVRGELVIFRSAFALLNSERRDSEMETFANPRNAAAGMIARVARNLESLQHETEGSIRHKKRQSSLSEAVQDAGRWLSFLAYESDTFGLTDASTAEIGLDKKLLASSGNAPFIRFLLPVSPFRAVEEEVDYPVDWLDTHGDELDAETDGVVVKFTDPVIRAQLGESNSAPRWALAFKFPNRPKLTVLREVEWNETRTGRVVPTAIFDPVELSGTTVTRATLNNIAFLEELDIWIGDTIEVTRANEVIPNVVRRVGEHTDGATQVLDPNGWPVSLEGFNYRRKGRDLVHDGGRDLVKDISFAASKLDILGLGEDVVRRLVEGNPHVSSFPQLLISSQDGTLQPFERGTQKLVDKLANEVVTKTSGRIDPAKWIAAAGVPGIGVRAGKKLCSIIVQDFEREYERMIMAGTSPIGRVMLLPSEVIASTPGFGDAITVAVQEAADVWQSWLPHSLIGRVEFDWEKYDSIYSPVHSATVDPMSPDHFNVLGGTPVSMAQYDGPLDPFRFHSGHPLAGRNVLVTGTLPSLSRKQAEVRIEELGGTVASSVSKNLDLLVAGEKAGSKLAKAERLGVAVMYGTEFEELE